MDYQEELKKLSGSYWKPKPGQFKIKALSELEGTDPFVKKTKDEEGNEIEESHEQCKITILIEGDAEEKTWTFGKGKTPASTYGQLIELATKNDNKLTDVEFSVVVKSDGVKNDYTIVSN